MERLELGGPTAVGAIAFAGAFLYLDGLADVYSLIEGYGKSTTWAVVLAGAALATSYTAGSIIIRKAAVLRAWHDRRNNRDPLGDFLSVALTENEQLIQRYRGMRIQQEFMQGAAISFALLGIGALFTSRWLPPNQQVFLYVVPAISWVLALALPLLAHTVALEASSLAERVRQGRSRQAPQPS